jgi:adenosylcobinamide-phosphate synthase
MPHKVHVNPALMLFTALLLDRILGDPNYAWHPVRLVGNFALCVENLVYPRARGRGAGLLAFCIVVATTVGTLASLLLLARYVHPLVEFVVGVLSIYISIAPHDLSNHATRVVIALERGELREAQVAVGAIVGRDTVILDESGVCRAAVETVAESTVDGVIAPLFWACLLGPLGAFGYRVINTLDSLWGHHDARYERFGFVAARADDVANYLPARLSLLFIFVAALVTRVNAKAAIIVGLRHGPRHASPNSGLSEAAFAGALEVTLGGSNRYDGQWHAGPTFGSCNANPTPTTIRRAITLMWVTTCIATLTFSLPWLTYWVFQH